MWYIDFCNVSVEIIISVYNILCMVVFDFMRIISMELMNLIFWTIQTIFNYKSKLCVKKKKTKTNVYLYNYA